MAHLTPGFDKLVQETLDKYKVPGLSLAIIQGDDIYSKGYGMADLNGKKCDENTLFDMASTSKTTTAAAVACLVDDENYPEVQWTTPVSKILPDDFVMADPEYTKNVTIEDILSHRSGLPRHDDSYVGIRAEHPDNAKSITRNLRNLRLNKPLRTSFQYCNIMYTVATHIVETVSGMPYDEFLRKKIWDPLGMSNTFHDYPNIPDTIKEERLSTGYFWNKEKEEYVAVPAVPQPEGQGAGSIISSAGDYAKWTRSLLKCKGPLSEDAYRELMTGRTIMPLSDDPVPYWSQTLYALGLDTVHYRGRSTVGHDGSVLGYKAVMRFIPDLDWGVVMFGNAEGAETQHQLLLHVLMDDVLKVAGQDKHDWSKYWSDNFDKEEEEEEERWKDPKFQVPGNPEPMSVPWEALPGKYFNKGYKSIILEMRDGKVVSQSLDRYPLTHSLYHLSGDDFAADETNVWSGNTSKLQMTIRSNNGKVDALGVFFDDDFDGDPIWFDKVE